MSEMIDGYTAQKIKDFWMTEKPRDHRPCMEVIVLRDEKISSLTEQLKIYREALFDIKTHSCFRAGSVMKIICQIAKEALERTKEKP